MNTLIELLPRIEALGAREAARFSNGVRTWTYSYRDLFVQIGQFAGFLDEEGLTKGDRLLLWSENRPEWIAVFWACLGRGVQVIPVDSHSSIARVTRICGEAGPKLVVHGNRTAPLATTLRAFSIEALQDLPELDVFSPKPTLGEDVVEILYTSGTTADPKGVVHRHRNICANLTPIAAEIDRYRKWARPFQPVRLLNMLPLSHMFGQSMGIFIPVLLEGAVVFMTDLNPAAMRQTIRREGVSVLVSVPRMLQALESDVKRRHPETVTITSAPVKKGIVWRWWRYRSIHAEFGWKFWAFVVGGAQLDEEVELFWGQLGLLVVQGYGLTETSPVVAVNHPFRAKRGTLGSGVGDQEIRIAEDGEILVRGASVVNEYLETGSVVRPATDEDGWFHTGDIGALDSEGRLIYRGRKKDVIVTADGLNIYPEDIEHVLNQLPGVGESVVVPRRGAHGERPHAVLIIERDHDPRRLVEQANQGLEPGQRIQTWSLWDEADFPRTVSTHKVQRRLVAERVGAGPSHPPQPFPESEGLIQALVGLTGRSEEEFREDKNLNVDLGLSSLERVDLLATLEERYGIELDEAEFSEISTVGELRDRIDTSRTGRPSGIEVDTALRQSARPRVSRGPAAPPRWAQSVFVRSLRAVMQFVLIRPLLRHYVAISVEGLENLGSLSPPVLFASNHASHMDAPVIVAALPGPWRRRVAPAVRREYFFGHTPPVSKLRSWVLRWEYYLACAVFNTYPLPQKLGQVREALRYTGELVSGGICPLVFPEGRLAPDGKVQTFRAGIGFMALHLRVPVVPVYVKGIFEILPVGSRWPLKGPVQVKIGKPVEPAKGEDYRAFASRLETVVRDLEDQGKHGGA